MAGPKPKRTSAKSGEEREAPPSENIRIPASIAERLAEKKKQQARAEPPQPKRLVKLRIRRQDAHDRPDTRRWEEFEVPFVADMTVNTALERIRKDPRTATGQQVAPPVWEASCLEETCGACAMLVNGRVRMACSTLVQEVAPKNQRITLEPLSKFPCERDLVVDRSRAFESLKQVKAWIAIDGTQAIGKGPRESQDLQTERYGFSRCMSCAACLEACPEYGGSRPFVGANAINQAHLMNLHPTGAMQKVERLESLMGEGGIADCGKAQNCIDVCPKDIPLVDSIGAVARDTTKRMLFGWLFK